MTISSAELLVDFKARQTGTNQVSPQDFSPDIRRLIQWSAGLAASQADLLYAARRSIAASANDDIDLSGVLTDAFGAVITAAELTLILIASAVGNLSSLTVGLGSNPFLGFLGGTTPTLGPVRPGGIFLLATPDAAGIGTVTAATADILRVANGAGGAAVYDIVLLGRSA